MPIEIPDYDKPEESVEASRLSKEDRQIKMNKIVIEHDRLTRAVDAIRMNHRPVIDGIANSGKFFALIGDTRSGKSFAADRYVKQNPRIQTGGGTKIPVLKINTPIDGTVHSVSNAILENAGAHVNPRLNATALMDTVIKLLPLVGCELLILDEFNEVANSTRVRAMETMRSFLRRLVDQAGVVAMLVGTEKTYDILAEDAQITGRNLPVHIIPSYNIKNAEDRKDFLIVCEAMDAFLPFRDWSGLSDERVARCLAEASGGLIGRLKNLICMAGWRALNDDAPRIEILHLAEAYGTLIAEEKGNQTLSHKNLNLSNPFRELLPGNKKKKAA